MRLSDDELLLVDGCMSLLRERAPDVAEQLTRAAVLRLGLKELSRRMLGGA